MGETIERLVNTNRHINGGHLSPISNQLFHISWLIDEKPVKSFNQFLTGQNKRGELLNVCRKSQYPFKYRSLQHDIFPDSRVTNPQVFSLRAASDLQVSNQLFMSRVHLRSCDEA